MSRWFTPVAAVWLATGLLLAATLLLPSGCTPPGGPLDEVDARDDQFLLDGKLDSALSPAEEAAVIALVNAASFEVLDDDVALDRRAAESIVVHRVGLDGIAGTADDDRIDDLRELDGLGWVGPKAFEQLLDYVRAMGLADGQPPCVIISEYLEADLDRNKAIELDNCGTEPVQLGELGVCMVRNEDTTCSLSTPLDPGLLAPGEVVTLCRSLEGTYNSPVRTLREACQQPLGYVMTFSGDDRMVIFRDRDADGTFEPDTDEIMDMLGRFTWHPSYPIWADVDLRRCNLTPYRGDGYYDHNDYFTSHRRSDYTHLGVPPASDCAGNPL